jgi:hypothetical protein
LVQPPYKLAVLCSPVVFLAYVFIEIFRKQDFISLSAKLVDKNVKTSSGTTDNWKPPPLDSIIYLTFILNHTVF